MSLSFLPSSSSLYSSAATPTPSRAARATNHTATHSRRSRLPVRPHPLTAPLARRAACPPTAPHEPSATPHGHLPGLHPCWRRTTTWELGPCCPPAPPGHQDARTSLPAGATRPPSPTAAAQIAPFRPSPSSPAALPGQPASVALPTAHRLDPHALLRASTFDGRGPCSPATSSLPTMPWCGPAGGGADQCRRRGS
jgi:hypothetical protein